MLGPLKANQWSIRLSNFYEARKIHSFNGKAHLAQGLTKSQEITNKTKNSSTNRKQAHKQSYAQTALQTTRHRKRWMSTISINVRKTGSTDRKSKLTHWLSTRKMNSQLLHVNRRSLTSKSIIRHQQRTKIANYHAITYEI